MSVPPVQTAKNADASSSASLAATFGSTVTSGNCVVGIISYNSGGVISTVADNQSNSYTVLDTVLDNPNGQKCSTFILGNITNAPNKVTVTFTAGTAATSICIAEYGSILAASNPNDGHTGQLQSATTAPTSGNITTTVNGDTIVGLIGYDTNFGTITLGAGSGYTIEVQENVASEVVTAIEDKVQTTAGSIAADWSNASGDWLAFIIALKPSSGAAALPSIGWYRREFEGVPPKALFLESPPALGIRQLPTPKPIIWREHDNVSFAKGRDDPGARGTSLTIPISHPIIPWREHDNIPFAKGRDDPGARGTSLTIPLAAPIIPRTSHDINPYAQGRDEPARWRIQVLPTPSPVLLAPHDLNPFVQGRSERPALGTALTIPTVPPVYNAPQNFNPFALGRSEPPAMGLPKLLVTTLAPLVFWREHDNTPYVQGRSEPSSRVFQLAISIVPPVYNAPHDFNPYPQGRSEPSPRVFALTIPTVPPVYNAPHDFNLFALGKSEPPAIGWRSLPTPSPVLLAPHDFNPFAQGRSEPSPWRIPVLVTPVQTYNAPHDFNPFALGRSEPPAIGWPKLLVAVLAPIVFNAPAIHTAFVQGSSEPAANGWMILQQPVVVVTTFHALPFFDTVGSLKTM